MGWKGAITMTSVDGEPESSVSCYQLGDSNLEQICLTTIELFLLDDIGIDGKRKTDLNWKDETEWITTLEDTTNNVTLNGNQVIFWTFIVPLEHE